MSAAAAAPDDVPAAGRRVAVWRHGTAVPVPPDEPVVTAFDLGLSRGDGVFESVLVTGGRTPWLADHLTRLARSAALLDLTSPGDDAWRALVAAVTGDWPAGTEGVCRLFLTRGTGDDGPPTALALLSAVPADTLVQRTAGISVVALTYGLAADVRAHAPWLLGGAKTLSYAVNMAAQRHAHAQGADDVVFTAVGGELLEGPTSTVVWAAGGVLHTPPVATGILAGTTQARLFARAADVGWPTAVSSGTVADLHAADAVWLLSGIRGAATVHTLDGVPRGDAGLGRQVRELLAR
ncbi:branched-chain amino acid aminotransferase [Modestobacter sp. I12A-02628]|uniref:Branched-chain amino acid aminotransferase n=1 Tax=Goekera deserti TaxID=2497753 RepID=A0A7K3W8V1_9ACTN|nr:aminotransferase class IV [Goekera deserti]MPR00450.1 branched-chain amino acid aminotransferase [Goekera deserti]NDI49153.1 branched-chain amino acid aminotransferase [Goekera deserti]NEL52891.1 branched-chain amino acid aminotransferase [Goekera deserti]